jgi:beta-RFAP synthase
MLAAPVEVVAPSRLHFGMFSFGQAGTRQFGGAGVMIDKPGLKLRIAPAERFAAAGPHSSRVQSIVERLAESWRMESLPACRVEVVAAPPDHVGLGTGTQLALSVTAGLQAFRGRPPLEAASLAGLSGRGQRSAIGTYGFLGGGFLVDSGKLAGETLAPLEHRIALPEAWRFVLICPRDQRGLSGAAEQAAFGRLPAVAAATSDALRREVATEMVPAARAGQFDRFSQSVWRFSRQAGLCFAAVQGGPFAGPRIDRWVEAIRAGGVEGVGQSSWGPLVFALVENVRSARRLSETLQPRLDRDDTLIVAEPNAAGARITRGPSDG